MARWLFKQEPSCYSYADLERDGSTVWDGVSNALAQKHLRQVRAGDDVLLYHTGKEKAIVGEMKVISAQDGVVHVAPARRWTRPVTLAEIKADPAFAEWELVRMSRLSVMPVPERIWKRLQKLAESDEDR
ncbi:MAG: EVE domain-containing protein [Gemmataceae bacterium]|nr:EVE domain-containing protein [Gemmataceae bacterium]